MEEFSGTIGNWHDGVFFTESTVSGRSPSLARVEVEISRQNSNLTEVKNEMARRAKAKGANVIQNFKYGQKAHQWWELIFTFKWDTECWYGSGDAIAIR